MASADSGGLKEFLELQERIGGLDADVELVYQVWSDLRNVRNWRDVVVSRHPCLDRFVLTGVPQDCDSTAPPGASSALVVPVRATEELPLLRISRLERAAGDGSESRTLVLAILDTDSTTVYYRLRPLNDPMAFLLECHDGDDGASASSA